MSDVTARLLATQPAPFWIIRLLEDATSSTPPFDWVKLLAQIEKELLGCTFRGVAFERLETVCRSGIDVIPSDSVIYADHFDKAWEYGGWPKLILALDPNCLQKTFTEIPADTPEAEIEVLRETFPTVIESTNGETLWMSKLRDDDPRVATGYETAYAWWIKGDAKKALKAAFVITRPQDDANKIDMANPI